MRKMIFIRGVVGRTPGIFLYALLSLLIACSDDETVTLPEEPKPLVTFYVHSNHPWLSRGDQGFVFASDHDGNVLAKQEVHAGDTVKLFLEDGQEVESFTLTEIYVADSARFYAYSYTDLPNGIRWRSTQPFAWLAKEGPSQGSITINASSPDDYNYVASVTTSGGFENLSQVETFQTISMPLMDSPGLLFVRTISPYERFSLYENVLPGQTINVDLTRMNSAFATEMAIVPEDIENPSVRLLGFRKANDYRLPYELGIVLHPQTTPALLYPDVNAFASFGSTTIFTKNGSDYFTYNKAAKYDFTVLDPELVVASKVGTRVTISCSDDEVDRVSLAWHYGQTSSLWLLNTAPGANRQLALPPVPDEVAAAVEGKISDNALFRQFAASFDAYENTAGYDDWRKQVSESDKGEEVFLRYDRNWKHIDMSTQ